LLDPYLIVLFILAVQDETSVELWWGWLSYYHPWWSNHCIGNLLTH